MGWPQRYPSAVISMHQHENTHPIPSQPWWPLLYGWLRDLQISISDVHILRLRLPCRRVTIVLWISKMTSTPNESTSGLISNQDRSTTQNSMNQPLPGFSLDKPTIPEPPPLPATTFKGPPSLNLVGFTLRRSLSLDPPKGPEITITRASSPECLERGLFDRSTTPEKEKEPLNEMLKEASLDNKRA
jgi:hypothetical protein